MHSVRDAIVDRLGQFVAASPQLLATRALASRQDTKLVMPAVAVPALLAELTPHYHVVHSGAAMLARYDTLYFDTDDFLHFHAHRRRLRRRAKVRIRRYEDQRVAFVEVKRRGDGAQTHKHRLLRATDDLALTAEERRFVAQSLGAYAAPVHPVLTTRFRRLTLVGLAFEERVTIDLELTFAGVGEGASAHRYERSAIVEVKQPVRARTSPAFAALRAHGARGTSFSKYCIAVTACRLVDRANPFLHTFRTLERSEHAAA